MARQQPRMSRTPPYRPHQPDQRRLPGRRRKVAPLQTPRPCFRKYLTPPPTPVPQRRHRNARVLGDGRQPKPAALNEIARRHEEANRRRRLTAAAVPATETETPDACAQGCRKTVRLAGIGRTVRATPAMRAAISTTAIGFRRVNPRQKGPDTGAGKEGTGMKSYNIGLVTVDLVSPRQNPSIDFLQGN